MRPMCSHLEKKLKFSFDEICLKGLEMLKRKLTEISILNTPNEQLPFQLMHDTST